jgi:hypothetical protein
VRIVRKRLRDRFSVIPLGRPENLMQGDVYG